MLTIFFCLALLLHLSLYLSFAVHLGPRTAKPVDITSMPAYIYHEEKYTPESHPQLPTEPVEKEKPVSKSGIEKPAPEKKVHMTQSKSETLSLGNGQQNVNLTLKSANKVDKPLLDILSKAVSAHLAYPKIAVDFRLMGRALVGFVVYPDGHLTDVTLVQSSGAEVLDQAALDAVNGIVPVKNVNPYLKKPEPLMIGIIFQ